MRNELRSTFEDHVTELKERLPRLKGDARRNAMARIESLTEFLELIDLIGGPRAGSAAHVEAAAPGAWRPGANPVLAEASYKCGRPVYVDRPAAWRPCSS